MLRDNAAEQEDLYGLLTVVREENKQLGANVKEYNKLKEDHDKLKKDLRQQRAESKELRCGLDALREQFTKVQETNKRLLTDIQRLHEECWMGKQAPYTK